MWIINYYCFQETNVQDVHSKMQSDGHTTKMATTSRLRIHKAGNIQANIYQEQKN